MQAQCQRFARAVGASGRDVLQPVEVGAAFAEHDAAREALHVGGGQIDRVYNDQRETNKLDRPDELGA